MYPELSTYLQGFVTHPPTQAEGTQPTQGGFSIPTGWVLTPPLPTGWVLNPWVGTHPLPNVNRHRPVKTLPSRNFV